MVVFTCGYCGDSVQKHNVEKHYFMSKCKNKTPNLSCTNCFKDFIGNDYEEHTKCVTDEQRYAAKAFVPKEKKGEKKQVNWVVLVRSVLYEQDNIPKNVIKIIEAISKHNNTPSKKPKFYNFVKNVCGSKTGAKDIERAWILISPKLIALANANQKNPKDDSDKTIIFPQKKFLIDADSQESSQDETTQDSHLSEPGEKETAAPAKNKKLSKKQRKEQQKRLQLEAERNSAEATLEEEEEDGKKGKKKKNQTESLDGETEAQKGKKIKRKRQDTINSVSSNQEVTESVGLTKHGKAKTQQKKPKVDEELEEGMSLHDQNVAKIRELVVTEKFDWHTVILSVLEKKGNELPFKRLQKKVLAEYSVVTGREIDDRIAEKFIKKLRSAPNVRVEKNKVTLSE